MSDYIKREDAIEAMARAIYRVFVEHEDIAKKTMSKVPSADVVERKRGHWVHLGGDEWCCSSCGRVIHTEGSWENPLSKERQKWFCEGCGADMRERHRDD